MGKRILAVDDDATAIAFIKNVLMPHGYDVTCAASGLEAIIILEKQTFDCLILDFYLPDRDGIDVVSEMFRKKDRTPVIVLSAKLDDYFEAAVMGFGNTREILQKPCSAEMLLKTVDCVIGAG